MERIDTLSKLTQILADEIGITRTTASTSQIKSLAQLVDVWTAAEILDPVRRQFGDALLGLNPIDTTRYKSHSI
jgi:hypothetical protein